MALWVRGPARLDELVDRSVAIVGSRASTAYGEHVAGELGYQLAERGLDGRLRRRLRHRRRRPPRRARRGRRRPSPCWPAASTAPTRRHTARCSTGSPRPGCWSASGRRAARRTRHRFLVRNRLIAALTRGTVVVEAAARSGAQATANRRTRLGQAGDGRARAGDLGDVASAATSCCADDGGGRHAGRLGGARHRGGRRHRASTSPTPPERPHRRRATVCPTWPRRVLDACPVRTGVSPERLAAIAGCDVLDVLRVLPALELAELVQWTGTGWRLAAADRAHGPGVMRRGPARRLDRPGGPPHGSPVTAGTADAARGAARLRSPRHSPGTRSTCAPSATCPSTPSAATSPTSSGCSTTWSAAAAPRSHDLDLATLRSWLAQGRTRGHSRATTARHAASARSFTAWLRRAGLHPGRRRTAAGQPEGTPHAARRPRARPGARRRRGRRGGRGTGRACATPSSSSCSTPAASGSASSSASTSTTSTAAAGCCGSSARAARSAACPTACRPSRRSTPG